MKKKFKVDSTEIENVFASLSERFYSENDLSDFTWALIESSSEFKNAFFNFLEIPDNTGPFEIYREDILPDYQRPDFRISFQNRKILVENKINDRNYHFKEYADSIQNEEGTFLILISAHFLSANDLKIANQFNWRVYYWSDLYHNFTREQCFQSNSLLKAYLIYIKEVCMIKEITKIEFDSKSLKSLYSFNNLIRKTVQTCSHDIFEYTLYTSNGHQRAFSDGYSGCYYCIKNTKNSKTAYPAIGIEFDIDEPTICMWIDKDWCPFFNTVCNLSKTINDERFEIELTDDCLIYWMPQKQFNNFNNSNKIEEQIDIIKSFILATSAFLEETIKNEEK